MKKKLGILGGMGPLATVKLFEKIVGLTDAKKDQDHLHIIVDNNVSIADRTDYILNPDSEDPRPQLLESALRLEASGVDFIIMPCNTAHYFYDYLNERVNIPFLNMIEETAKLIQKTFPNLDKIGLLATDGTIKARVYESVFNKYGIEVLIPSKENQANVYRLIYEIKEGKRNINLEGFYGAIEELKDKGADLFVAGCTEISVALDLYQVKENFVDPLEVIASSSIEYAGGKCKKI